MARSGAAGVSNADADREEASRAGTSSSISGSRRGRSGSSGTPGPRSPAPDAESRSDKDLHPRRAQISSVSSTDTSTQETGSSPVPQPDSSVASPVESAPTQDPAPDPERSNAEVAAGLIASAHAAFESKDYDQAENLLREAEGWDPTVAAATAGPHAAIAAAKAAAS